MQIEGTNSSSATTSNMHFGSFSRSMSSDSASHTEDQLNYIYQEVVKLHKALESTKDYFRLRSDGDAHLVMSKTKAGKIAELFKDAAEALNRLFDDRKIQSSSNGDLETFVSEIRSDLKSAVSEAFDSTSSTLQTGYGITFDFSVSARRVVDFTSLDQNELIKKLTTDGGPMDELFYGKKNRDNDGLIEKMLKALESAKADLKDILGTSGVFVDTRA
jgi:hypothetical protein